MITIICGIIRRGKSSLCTYLGIENAIKTEKRQKMFAEINRLKKLGYNINSEDYALYANYNINYNRYDRQFSAKIVDVDKIGLTTKDGVFLRPHSTLCITEAQTHFSTKMIHRLKPEQQRFFFESGHFGIDIFLDCPRGDTIEPDIRAICERFIYVERRRVYFDSGAIAAAAQKVSKYNFGKIEWDLIEYDNENIFMAQKGGKKRTIKCDYNIFDCYNPFQNFDHFLPPSKDIPII